MNTQILRYLLSGTTLCNYYKERCYSILKKFYESVAIIISPKIYMFFEEYSMPFPVFSLNMDRNLIGKPTIIYNADEYVFFPYIPLKSFAEIVIYNKANPVSILSMEIIDDNERCVKDLTDFIEKLRYIHIPNMEVPTISNIIAAWCVTNSLPLNRKDYSVRYIRSNGDEIITSLIDMTPIDEDSVE